MKIFVSSQNTPIGYSTPAFPSLFWPLGADVSAYQRSFLYDLWIIWKFTVFWAIICFAALHFCSGLIAAVAVNLNRHRHKLPVSKTTLLESVFVVGGYLFVGLFKGFAAGAIIGLLLAAIYRAGSLPMSTWIPFTWGVASIMFDICSSYSHSSVIL
jgi:hypothetical protein